MGRSPASAAGQFEDDGVARLNLLHALCCQLLSGSEISLSCRAGIAAAAPHRRVLDPVEHRIDEEWKGAIGLDFDDLSETAAVPSGAPRIWSQLLALNNDW